MSNTLIAQLNNPVVLLQINQRLATAMSVVLIIACAYLLVEVTWLFFPQDDTSALPAQQKNSLVNNRLAQQETFRKLTSANIFGVSENTVMQRQTKVPVTRLNLTLKGVLAAEPMELASAIIAQGKSGKEDIYAVGDKMQGGVVIREILPDHVVLERNGRLENLMLQKISGVSGFKSTGKSYSNSSASNSPAAALALIRNDILKNPASFGDYALPVVVRENGRQVGYRLQPQEKGEMLAELGIQSSDVIVEINGVKLDKPQNGIRALRKLSTAKNLTIVVKRNGAEVPLNISLQ